MSGEAAVACLPQDGEKPGEASETLTIMTWNINCLVPTVQNMKLRHKSFRGFLDHWGIDVACLQEVKLPEGRITRELACVESFQSFWATSKSKPGYSGVTTWCRAASCAPHNAAPDCLGGDERPELDTEGRMVLTDHGAFVLINVYVPNAGDRPERARLPYKVAFLRALKAKMDELTAMGRQVIAVGDFNVAAESRDVHTAIQYDTLYDTEELAEFRNLIAAYPDVWRVLHPGDEGVFTVWEERTSARAFNVGLRIDYVLVSPALLPCVASCDILTAADIPPKWSDHAAVRLRLRVSRGQPPATSTAAQIAPTDATIGTATSSTSAPGPRLPLLAPPASPCPLWLALESRFVDRNQRSIKDMFGRRPAGSVPTSTSATAAAAAAVSGGGGSGAGGVGRKRSAPDGDGDEAERMQGRHPPGLRQAHELEAPDAGGASAPSAGVSSSGGGDEEAAGAAAAGVGLPRGESGRLEGRERGLATNGEAPAGPLATAEGRQDGAVALEVGSHAAGDPSPPLAVAGTARSTLAARDKEQPGGREGEPGEERGPEPAASGPRAGATQAAVPPGPGGDGDGDGQGADREERAAAPSDPQAGAGPGVGGSGGDRGAAASPGAAARADSGCIPLSDNPAGKTKAGRTAGRARGQPAAAGAGAAARPGSAGGKAAAAAATAAKQRSIQAFLSKPK